MTNTNLASIPVTYTARNLKVRGANRKAVNGLLNLAIIQGGDVYVSRTRLFRTDTYRAIRITAPAHLVATIVKHLHLAIE